MNIFCYVCGEIEYWLDDVVLSLLLVGEGNFSYEHEKC